MDETGENDKIDKIITPNSRTMGTSEDTSSAATANDNLETSLREGSNISRGAIKKTTKPPFVPPKKYKGSAAHKRNVPVDKIEEGTPAWKKINEAERRDQRINNRQAVMDSWNQPDGTKPTPTEVEAQYFQEIDFDHGKREYHKPTSERSDYLDDDRNRQSVAGAISGDDYDYICVPEHTQYIDTGEVRGQNNLKPRNIKMRQFLDKLKWSGFLARLNSTKNAIPKVKTIGKPPLNKMRFTDYSGMLTKTVTLGMGTMLRNTYATYCMLSNQQFICYSDPTSGIIRKTFPLHNIYALQIVLPSSLDDLYCFELWISNGKGKVAPWKEIFTCESFMELKNWAQNIAERLTGAFLSKYTANYTRMGWCYIKEGDTGRWRSAWLMLTDNVLLFTDSENSATVINLRRTKCVEIQVADEEAKKLCPSETNYNLVLDCPVVTIYLRFPYRNQLCDWRYMLMVVAQNIGAHIYVYPSTIENVVVRVAKCICLIYDREGVSECIYHHEDVIALLNWFLRDLSEMLLPRSLQKAMLCTIDKAVPSSYCSLSLVAHNTARKLFAHLHYREC